MQNGNQYSLDGRRTGNNEQRYLKRLAASLFLPQEMLRDLKERDPAHTLEDLSHRFAAQHNISEEELYPTPEEHVRLLDICTTSQLHAAASLGRASCSQR